MAALSVGSGSRTVQEAATRDITTLELPPMLQTGRAVPWEEDGTAETSVGTTPDSQAARARQALEVVAGATVATLEAGAGVAITGAAMGSQVNILSTKR